MISPDDIGFRGLKSYLFYGDKGNGKSLFTAYLVEYLLDQYDFTQKKYPDLPHRQVWSNQSFGKLVNDRADGRVHYWENPRQLYDLRNCDIIWDEVGKDIPATGFKDTPKKLRQVFSHLRKRGNRLFANTQVYNDIDISFRRQVDRTFKLNKILGSPDITASLPPVKNVWGVIMIREMDKRALEDKENIDKSKEGALLFQIPKFFFITKKLVSMYDTQAEITPYRPTELEHLEFTCPHPGCGKLHIEHAKM